ncbi:S8 family serine peptidase [Halohasta salina]|uniref:S8 family serine peptidase n=1 Tax=Halohasta salina TaxID=2961621 RepID=UPI0020A439E2|nr:S8 family serine peptidase [Halohasta salina]
MKDWLSHILVVIIAIFFIIGSGGLVAATESTNTTHDQEDVRALIQLAEIESFDSKEDLKQQTKESQRPVIDYLEPLDAVAVERQFWISNSILVTVDTDRMQPDELVSHSQIVAVEVDKRVEVPDPYPSYGTESMPDDPGTYGLEQTNAPDAWETFDTQGEGVTVGVIDTGINPNHISLELNNGDSTNNYKGAWHTYYYPNGSFTLGDTREGVNAPEPFDSDGHGTHVSGTIAGGNQTGTAIGVAPDVRLIHSTPLYDGSGYGFDIIGSMQWMAEQDPDIVSMSLGSSTPTTSELEEVQNLRTLGITVVSSSGNSGEGHIGFPSAYEPVIGVGATDSSRNVPSFSSGGTYNLDEYNVTKDQNSWEDPQVSPYIVAPGDSVWSASYWDEDSLTRKSGTSMAAPHVSGIVALMLANNPSLTPAQIEYVLREGATDAVGVPDGRNTRSGYGIANAYNSLALSNPGGFATVSSVDAPSGVEYGDTLVVTANISNVNVLGDEATRTVTTSLNGTVIGSESVQIPSGETQELTFEYQTTEADTGVKNVTIETGDVTYNKSVTIAGPAEFQPEINGSNVSEPFVVGEEASFNVTVTNVGDLRDTGNLSLYVNESLVVTGDNNIPELGPNNTTDVEFNYTATEADLPRINITAVTDTQQTEYWADVAEPASFDPTINTSATDPFVVNETATITVDVENVGGISGPGSADLYVNETLVETGAGNIPETGVGEQATVAFEYNVTDTDYPELNVTVKTETGASTEMVEVLRPAESAVSITAINSPVESEQITVDFLVENTGDLLLEQNVTTTIGGFATNNTSVVLDGGNSTALSVGFPTDVGDYGTYTAEVSTPNSTATQSVTVLRQATFDIEVASITSPVSAGDPITATVDVENIGNVSGTQPVTFSRNGSEAPLDSNETTLDADASTQLTFEYDTDLDDIGENTFVFASNQTSANGVVIVEDPNPAEITAVEAQHDLAGEVVTVNGTVTAGSLPVDSVSFALEANFTAYRNKSAVEADVSSGGDFSTDIPVDHLVGDGRYTPVATAVDNASQEVSQSGSPITIDTTPPEIRLDTENLTSGSGTLLVEGSETFEITDVTIEADDGSDRSPGTKAIPSGLQAKGDTASVDFNSSQSATPGVSIFNITVKAVDTTGNSISENLTASVESYDLTGGRGTVSPSANSQISVIANETEVGSTATRKAIVSSGRTSPAGTALQPNQIGGGFINVNDIGLTDSELENASIHIPLSELDRDVVEKFDTDELMIMKSDDGNSDYYEIETEYNSTANALVATVDGFSQFAAGGVDTAAPEVNSVSVTPGTEIKSDSGPINVVFEYTDQQSGINVSETAVVADVDSNRYTATTTSAKSEIEVTGLSDGESIKIELTVTDKAGNTATETVTVDVDDSSNSKNTGGSSSGGSSSSGGGGGGGGSGSFVRSALPTPHPEDVVMLTLAKGRIKSADGYSYAQPGSFLDRPVIETVIWDDQNTTGEIEVRDYSDMPSRAGTPPGELVSANEIMVPYKLRDETATLRFNLKRVVKPQRDLSKLDRETLTIWQEVDGEWEPLKTEVVKDTDEAFVLEASTDHFSHMAVTTATGINEDATEDLNAAEEGDESGETDDDTPGFGFGLAIVALLASVWMARLKSSSV